MVVREALAVPIVTEKEVPEFNKKTCGKAFGKDFPAIQTIVGNLDEATLIKIKGEIAQG